MKRLPPLRRFLVIVGICVGGLTIGFAASKPPLLDNVSFSRAVFDRDGRLMRLTLSQDQKYRLFVPLKDVSPRLINAVLLNEDQYFYDHLGINPASLVRAFFHTYVVGGRKIGASTISMQLARLQFGINSHSVGGKFLQIIRALQLEAHYSKDQLLEAYLNRVSYGYNIEGAGAASYIYFHTRPRDLTLPEAVTLAVIPQSPTRRRPERDQPGKPALLEARNRLFARWIENHPDDAIQKPFFELPLATTGMRDLPFEAPHLTHDLLATFPHQKQITASIDMGMQNLLEGILTHYVEDRRDNGINNASALLVDTRTMEVIASIGSADFANRSIQGQVDGTRAKRSPGSTLKPFIYGLAIDQGLIHPLSVLGDTAVSYGNYTPDNFDRDFRGPISAREALRLSRNIPAIKLAAQLHDPDLYTFLQNAGIAGLRDRSAYGLSLVLGGAELTARELAALYAMLANDGQLRPLVLQMTQGVPEPPKQMLSPEASFMVLDMLSDMPKPFATRRGPLVYWKTGTSNGFRDAWTAGIFGHYVLIVWVGNFNNANNAALVGLHAAAPLFFALAEAVDGKAPNPDVIAGKADHLHIRKIDVCATTGDISSDGCPAQESTWFIPGVSPIENHDVYRKILINLETGKRACHARDGLTAYRTFEVWPSDLADTLERAGIHKPPLPAWDDGCNDAVEATDGQHPVITSPQNGVQYHIRLAETGETIGLIASADGAVHTLHWFIGNKYLGTSAPGKPLLWKPEAGAFNVRVVDDQGHSDTSSISVDVVQ